MQYIVINGREIAANVYRRRRDTDWNNRTSYMITLPLTYQEAIELFKDGVTWGLKVVETSDNDVLEPQIMDLSEFSVAGSITDNRDGTVTVKMGMRTELEVTTGKSNDLDALVTALLALPKGQLKKVLSDEVLTVLKKHGYTEE